jgi:hypothetical protein
MQSSRSKTKTCQEFFLLRVCKIKKKLAFEKTCDTLKKIKNQKQIKYKKRNKKILASSQCVFFLFASFSFKI